LPRFSIIVPTTRPHLLRYSVRSILAQTFADFEVVVSDNHAAGASVEEAARGFGDQRVRYVRTGARLPIHKSWEFALEHARGDWVLLLADDDVILPGLLAGLEELSRSDVEAEAVTWRHGGFVDPLHPSMPIRGRADLPPHTGEVLRYDNRDNLKLLFELGGSPEQFAAMKRRQPHPAQSAYRADLVQKIKARSGDLFLPTTPDWAAITQILAAGKYTHVIDRPYTLYNSTVDSNAAAATGD
jgi:glycosyltransferase involved in cell wall biosynthesis